LTRAISGGFSKTVGAGPHPNGVGIEGAAEPNDGHAASPKSRMTKTERIKSPVAASGALARGIMRGESGSSF
jgi:hypothetical protein